GVIGYLAYEFGRFTEPPRAIRLHTPRVPLAVVRRYDPVLVLDRTRGQWALACGTPRSARSPWLERLAGLPPTWSGPLARGPLRPLAPRDRALDAIRDVLAY